MVPISPSSRYFGFYRPFYERIRLELKPRPDKFTCSSKPVSRCHFTLTYLPTFKVSECFWRRAGGVEELRTCGVFVCVCLCASCTFFHSKCCSATKRSLLLSAVILVILLS